MMPRRIASWAKRIDGWSAGQKALSESETCARMDPGSAEAHYRLAQIYEHMGAIGKAEKGNRSSTKQRHCASRTRMRGAQATMKTFIYTMQNGAQEQKECVAGPSSKEMVRR